MNRPLLLCLLLLLWFPGILWPVGEIQTGQSREEVLRRLGPPDSEAVMGAREILYYGKSGRIELVDGQVVKYRDLPALTTVPSRPVGRAEQPAAETAGAPEPLPGDAPAAGPATPPETLVTSASPLAEVVEDLPVFDPMASPVDLAEEFAPPAYQWPLELAIRFLIMAGILRFACKYQGVEIFLGGLSLLALADVLLRWGVQAMVRKLFGMDGFFHLEDIVGLLALIALLPLLSSAKSFPSAVRVAITAKIASFFVALGAIILLTSLLR